MMAGPKTKDWRALENKHKPNGLHVLVGGLVEVKPNQAPMLTERAGGSGVLELALTVGSTSDPNFDAMVWKQASFHKEVKANQFNTVRVMSGDRAIANFPVLDDSEHSELVSKQMAAQNAVAGTAQHVKAKKSAAKKTVKKAVEAVKGAVRTVKKAAKSLARKVTGKKATKKAPQKKAAKKAAKKTAKKTARRPMKKYARRPAKKAKAVRRPARKAKRR
jgi:hypothetical protein